MKALLTGAGLALALTTATFAQDASLPLINGTVTKIDKTTERVTLNHDPIPNLDMSDMMGMVFRVGDKAMLDELKAGQAIEFQATRVNGQITLVKVQPKAK